MTIADGHQVTVLVVKENASRYRALLEEMGVECTCNSTVGYSVGSGDPARFGELLRQRSFQVAVLVAYEVYVWYAAAIRACLPRCHLVLDTVDLHGIRLRREAALSKDPESTRRAEEVAGLELKAIGNADSVWTVTEAERNNVLATRSDQQSVSVVPNIHAIVASRPGFETRRGIVFLGGYRHRPNIDAVEFLLDVIVPRLDACLPEIPITIAGSHPPESFKSYQARNARLCVTGFIQDHREVLLANRIGVAPLRYGAGMKGKIAEYLCCGLPCVTSTVGAEGMDFNDGTDVLIADDPDQFARAVSQLYNDPILWQRLADSGVDYIERRLSPGVVLASVRNALAYAESAKPGMKRRDVFRRVTLLADPRKVTHLAREAVESFRHEGASKFVSRVKMWLNEV